MCSTLFSFAQLAAKQRSPQRETTTFASNDNAGATCILFPHDFFSLLDHKKLHAKKPFGSTIWTTKSCTRKHPSGARFGAQKVARENTLLEHDLGHKKLHAKRPIWSTIWSTKSCTRKRPSGARFGAQKVAREKTVSGARFGAQKVAREEPPSGARFRAQKVARKKADLEHDLDHKNLHATKPIWSTEDSLEWIAASAELKARYTAGFAQVQDTSGVLFFSSFLHLCN